MGLAMAPGIERACGAADRLAPPGYVGQRSGEGEAAAQGMSVHSAVQVEAGGRVSAAGQGEKPDPGCRSMEPGSGVHKLLVPAVHRKPSAVHTACLPFPPECGPAFPLGICGGLEVHSPDQGTLVLVDPQEGAPVGAAGGTGLPLHIPGSSSSPLDPWNLEAGFYLEFALRFQGS